MSSVVCLHEPHHWTKSIKIHTETHARVSVCAEADASGDLRKVRLGSFVLHASCFRSATVGKAQNVDDLYWVTLRRLGMCRNTNGRSSTAQGGAAARAPR